MGKLIISGDFCSSGIITSISEATGFSDDNVNDYWHLKMRYRCNALPKSDTDFVLKFDMKTAQTVAAIVINDVNSDYIRIRGHATDLANNWAGATFDSGDVAVSLDPVVNRYKVYLPLTAFNYRWLALQMPAAASAVGDYTAKWEVGSVVPLDSVTELSRNMSFGYQRTAEKPYEDIPIPHGGFQRASLGDDLAWADDVVLGRRTETEELELWTINRYDIGSPVILYENRGDASKVYLCLRDDAYQGTLVTNNSVVGNTIRFKELI